MFAEAELSKRAASHGTVTDIIDTASTAVVAFYCGSKVQLRERRQRGGRPRHVVVFHSARSVRGRNLCRAMMANFLLAPGFNPHVTRNELENRISAAT